MIKKSGVENMLHKIKKKSYEYYLDDHGVMQGEYKTLWHDGSVKQHSFVKDDKHHGECVLYDRKGEIISRKVFYEDKILVEDAMSLSNEDRFEMALKYTDLRWILT